MLGKSCYDYIQIGLSIRILRNVDTNSTVKFVKGEIDDLKRLLTETNFEVTLSALDATEIVDISDELDDLDDNEKISTELKSKIQLQYKDVEFVVFSESATKKIYDIPKRRFNSDYLLNTPDKLLAKGVFNKLESVAQHDIRSACRCLLFGEATAVAFHILRATESTLKSYYFLHRKQNRLPKPMWANMVDQLKAKTRNKPPEHLLATLDIIRTVYRNPTQHPQATYEIDAAQDLFGVCLDAIGKMGNELT